MTKNYTVALKHYKNKTTGYDCILKDVGRYKCVDAEYHSDQGPQPNSVSYAQ